MRYPVALCDGLDMSGLKYTAFKFGIVICVLYFLGKVTKFHISNLLHADPLVYIIWSYIYHRLDKSNIVFEHEVGPNNSRRCPCFK